MSLPSGREWVVTKAREALLAWDRESERLSAEARARVLARSRRIAEGSREWDLLVAEELGRLFEELSGRGE